jgi:hypothetical protein
VLPSSKSVAQLTGIVFIVALGSLRMDMKRAYPFDFRRINIYFLFCRTNSVRDLIFV